MQLRSGKIYNSASINLKEQFKKIQSILAEEPINVEKLKKAANRIVLRNSNELIDFVQMFYIYITFESKEEMFQPHRFCTTIAVSGFLFQILHRCLFPLFEKEGLSVKNVMLCSDLHNFAIQLKSLFPSFRSMCAREIWYASTMIEKFESRYAA